MDDTEKTVEFGAEVTQPGEGFGLPDEETAVPSAVTADDSAAAARPAVSKAGDGGSTVSKDAGGYTEDGERIVKIFCYNCSQKLDMTRLQPFSHILCPSCGVELIVPKWFEDYMLEEPGGEGGMACVYRALDLALDREVAIKILNPEVADRNDASDLYLHEARTAATINHLAVIPIYTCGEFNGQPYIVMQFMSGGSLDDKLDSSDGKVPIDEAVKWLKDVAEGLDNARRHGIIHHDVKPGNIMLDADGNAKIGDFGIAQALNDARGDKIYNMTRTWLSPHFVSPEKVAEGKEDFRGDIYSLGASFYNVLTGTPPFDSEEIQELINLRLKGNPKPPKELRPDIPSKISALIMSMLEREPDDRPNYREIIDTISDYQKDARNIAKLKAPGGDKKNGNVKTNLSIKPGRPASMPRAKATAGVPRAVAAAAIIALLLFAAWYGGYFDDFSENMPPNTDRLPGVTIRLEDGECELAGEMARRVIGDPSRATAEYGQACLQLALAEYLANRPDAEDRCADITARLLRRGLPANDPIVTTVKYLAGDGRDANALRTELAAAALHQPTCELAILLKAVRNGGDKASLVKAVDDYAQMAAKNPQLWTSACGRRVDDWRLAIANGKGDPIALEPLFTPFIKEVVSKPSTRKRPAGRRRAPASGFDISSLTAAKLAASRGAAAERRPRPQNYEFSQQELTAYLKRLDAKNAKNEARRWEQVAGLKAYLCQLMMRAAYDGGSIRLRNGKTLRGEAMGNSNYISVRTNGGRKRVRWSDLPVEQIAAMLENYADTRAEAEISGGHRGDAKYEAAWDYLRIALLYDWYGNYDKAVDYARKATEIDSRIIREIQRHLM